MKIVIDSEFQNLIPPLMKEEYEGLEASILSEGCRDPIVLWGNTIVDGHNRYKICTAHNIPYNTVQKAFTSREDVKLWMIGNQLARRNINNYARTTLECLSDEIQAKRLEAKARQAEYHGNQYEAWTFCEITKSPNPKIDTTKDVARRANVGEQTASRVMTLNRRIDAAIANNTTVAGKNPEVLKTQLMKGDITINKAYQDMRREEKQQVVQQRIQDQLERPRTSNHVDIRTTARKYRVIYADPPWSYNDTCSGGGVQSRGASGVYPTMTLEDICALPVPTADNAVLFLWATSPMLEDAFRVINAWGFKYKASFVWDKVAHNMGHYNSVRHELLLVCTRGSCTPDVPKLFDSVVSIQRSEHSKKPKEFRDMIDALYPVGERVELFAREASDGWDVWGNMA